MLLWGKGLIDIGYVGKYCRFAAFRLACPLQKFKGKPENRGKPILNFAEKWMLFSCSMHISKKHWVNEKISFEDFSHA